MNDAPLVPPPGQEASGHLFVGLGASAGGLKALLEFFEHAPVDAGMTYVVILHLSPEHESQIASVLKQATTMPVEPVIDVVKVKPDCVYVISPKSQLRMEDGTLEAVPFVQRPAGRMTIDVFFDTLAAAHGNRAAAIVLSGTGSDGTLGVRSVKAQGGLTFAQSPEEAEYESMPRNAIASGAVDFVMPVADMPQKLRMLWKNARAIKLPALAEVATPEDAVAEAEEAIRDILATVRARTGHDFSQYKRATLLRRFERRLQVNQLCDLRVYRDFMRDRPAESNALLRDLLIGVTWFFRDPGAWAVLEQRVIPALLSGKDGGNVRIWVAGCATGEEAYSLAMLLQEHLDGMKNAPTVNIFATDIDGESLAFARAGLYPDTIAEHVSPERLRRFFVREHASYRIQKALREMVMFAVHNVIQDPPFSRLDLIACRNLLIYLNRHVQAKVLDLLHFALKPDGFLFLGMSESVEDGHDGFATIDKTHRIFAQQPRARVGVMLAALPMLAGVRPPPDGSAGANRRLVAYPELHQRLLEFYAPPSLVVDDRFDIVHLSDRAGHFLHIGAGEPSLNLFKVLPESVRFEMKAALDQALSSMRSVERMGIVFERSPALRTVDVKVHPVRDRGTGRMFALIVFDETAAETLSPAQDPAPSTELQPETSKLEQRLHDVEAQLRAAVEQYEVQNEELKASNEELQATNEELRATTEELETGKEELQSINEELTTVNQELKNKVDEATRISDDLQNFITATEIASIFVDRDLRLMRYTPFAREIFNVIPSDIGRPLLDITHRLEGIDLEAGIADVFKTLHVGEHEAHSRDQRWYIVRFLPYRTVEDRIRGAVLTFIDITQRKLAEAASRRSEAWARRVVESVRDYAIVSTDSSGIMQTWSAGARRIFGYESSEVIGRNIEVLFTPEDRAGGAPQEEMRRAREAGCAEDDRWHVRKDGTRFYASGMCAPLADSDVWGYVKLLRDTTEQHAASERRDELLATERISRVAAEEANRLKDEFLAMLSHELRNPLALMLMQSEILLRAPETVRSSRLQQAAQVIHEMVKAQAQLVEDMLDVSRARTGKLAIERQLLPLTFLIADSIGALRREAEAKKITLDVSIPDIPLIVEADTVRVRQIAWNLLSNALKFTPAGGTIRVRLTREEDEARFDVEDTGEGIAPDVLPRIFEWFRQGHRKPGTSHGGLGIGLALVRQLVELHGGRVEAFSEGLGKGARFTVWLPLHGTARDRDAPVALPATDGAGPLDGLAILVVDDSQSNADAMHELLDLVGAKTSVTTSGREALAILGRDRVDAIISDIAIPDLDGYALLAAVRQGDGPNRQTPAIAYSGYSEPDEANRRSPSFDRYLTKPVDLDSLIRAIRELTNGRPRG